MKSPVSQPKPVLTKRGQLLLDTLKVVLFVVVVGLVGGLGEVNL